jgi:hypothetical protein
MEDLGFFLTSINKISLLAFMVTFGFLGYEIYLFQKERKEKTKPRIPNFNENTVINASQSKVLLTQEEKAVKKSNNVVIVVLAVLLLVFGLATVIGFKKINRAENEPLQVSPTPIVNFINSKGIKILDEKMVPLADLDLNRLKSGNMINIGIETIGETDIDMARIKVNRQKWEPADITTAFDKKNNIFYIKYTVATGESQLKIDAQLHSKVDGWLGE